MFISAVQVQDFKQPIIDHVLYPLPDAQCAYQHQILSSSALFLLSGTNKLCCSRMFCQEHQYGL